MNTYIFSATELEVAPLQAYLLQQYTRSDDNSFIINDNHNIKLVIHGVGFASALLCMQQHILKNDVHLLLQVGIAGTYVAQHNLGDVGLVHKDCFADLGAEDNSEVVTLNLPSFYDNYVTDDFFVNPLQKLPPSISQLSIIDKAITVQTCSGITNTIQRRQATYKPDIETMEGAASHVLGLMYQIPFAQIRAISNVVEVRNTANWQIDKAVATLNDILIKIVQSL